VEEAMEWMLAHAQDSDLNSPFEQSGSSDTTSVEVETLLAMGMGFEVREASINADSRYVYIAR
jgi:uncharacterized UBP type Zn finger protein